MTYCKNCGAQIINPKQVICTKCGLKPLAGDKFCQHCGKEVQPGAEACLSCGMSLKTVNIPGLSGIDLKSGLSSLDIKAEDFKDKDKLVNKILPLAAIISFAIAALACFFSINTDSIYGSSSVFDAAFNKNLFEDYGNFLAIFAFLLPILGVACNFIEPLKKHKRIIMVFSAILAEGAFLVFIPDITIGGVVVPRAFGYYCYELFINIAWIAAAIPYWTDRVK